MANLDLWSNHSIQQFLAWIYGETALGDAGYDGILGVPGDNSCCRTLIRKFEEENALTVDGGLWGWECQQRACLRLTQAISLTDHFSSAEFGCRIAISEDDTPSLHSINCMHYPEVLNHTALRCLERTRQAIGSAIQITSGVRCPDYNASLSGSSSTSRHLLGRAFDCNTLGACSYEDLLEIGLQNGFTYGYVGDGFTHLQYDGSGY